MTSQAFTNKLKENFSFNEPIFTEELLKLFSNKSRAQVFRYVEEAKESETLVQDTVGVYYLPKQTDLGLSTLSTDKIVEKKYIKNKDTVYGVYSNIKLLNMFGVTTQMAGVITIVSNKESSKKRMITLNERRFILKKSRCKINSENYAAYTLLELFNCIDKNETICKDARERILYFIKGEKIGVMDIVKMAKVFPSKAIKNFMKTGIIYEIIWR